MTPLQQCTYCKIRMKHEGTLTEHGWVIKRMYRCNQCHTKCTVIVSNGETLWYFIPDGPFGRDRRR